MKLSEITSYLESIAPLRFQENYDNAGLLYGSPDEACTGAVIALDMTEEVVVEAMSLKSNLVIAHHPIIFRGIKKFDHEYYVHKAVITAIKNDIALYAIHTNLDNVLRSGVNEMIAKILDLRNIQVLRPHPSAPMEPAYILGSGAIGSLSSALSQKEFLHYVKEHMKLKVLRHTALLDRPISKVALCGGSGSFLLETAINAGADAFISSDFKYHDFFEANNKITVLDIGHYESEYFTIKLIRELLSKKFPKFAAHYSKVVTNPVNYY